MHRMSSPSPEGCPSQRKEGPDHGIRKWNRTNARQRHGEKGDCTDWMWWLGRRSDHVGYQREHAEGDLPGIESLGFVLNRCYFWFVGRRKCPTTLSTWVVSRISSSYEGGDIMDREVAARVKKEVGDIDVLVNNGGHQWISLMCSRYCYGKVAVWQFGSRN